MESKWFEIKQIVGNTSIRQSKFRSPDFSVTCEEVKAQWPEWSLQERVEFLSAYSVKKDLLDEDLCIMDFLMEKSDEYTPSVMAGSLTRYPDRTKVIKFLSGSLKLSGSKANQLFALGTMGSSTAADEIQALVQLLATKPHRDAWDNLDYVYACWALSKLDRKAPQSVEELASSSDETLAKPAMDLLAGNASPWWLRSAGN
jgi:hypothetical protein